MIVGWVGGDYMCYGLMLSTSVTCQHSHPTCISILPVVRQSLPSSYYCGGRAPSYTDITFMAASWTLPPTRRYHVIVHWCWTTIPMDAVFFHYWGWVVTRSYLPPGRVADAYHAALHAHPSTRTTPFEHASFRAVRLPTDTTCRLTHSTYRHRLPDAPGYAPQALPRHAATPPTFHHLRSPAHAFA